MGNLFLQSTHDRTIGVNETSERDNPLTHHRNSINKKKQRPYSCVPCSHRVDDHFHLSLRDDSHKNANMENIRI